MGTARWVIAFLSLTLSSQVFAAEPYLPIPQWPLPQNFLSLTVRTPTKRAVPAVDVNIIASELKRQLEAALVPLSSPAPECSSPTVGAYTLALRVAGRFDDCVSYAKSCAANLPSPKALWNAAACAETLGNFSSAEDLFQTATSAKFNSSPDYAEAVFLYASYALRHGQNDVKIILSRNWSGPDLDLWNALEKRIGHMDINPYTKPQVDAFLETQIAASGSPEFQGLLKLARLQVISLEYKYAEALNRLVADMASFPDPLWYQKAYRTVYRAFDTNFAEARKVYDAYDPYANWSWSLPTEDNTYNYTELYASVCRASLLQGNDLGEFAAFKEKLRKGELSPQQALAPIENFVKRFLDKADVLTTYGGILALLDRHSDAIANYWKAHRACRYYNRANWGLELEQRNIFYTHMPDYAENASRVGRELKGRQIPSEISSYIVNWNSLSPMAQERVEYGARIWLPYMKPLNDNQYRTYIKFAFDLLSESPGMATIHDQRIGGEGYPNDNRLWDDVRGVGGETVVADLGELFESVQGEYNLLGHEITHQFQNLLELKSPTAIACVVNLYAAAKSRGVFSDPYASQNKEEYFAQGVTYFLVPADSPARFGLNQTWLTSGDPDLLNFVQSIESASGDLDKIGCSPKPELARQF